jgi:hypothetical protein
VPEFLPGYLDLATRAPTSARIVAITEMLGKEETREPAFRALVRLRGPDAIDLLLEHARADDVDVLRSLGEDRVGTALRLRAERALAESRWPRGDLPGLVGAWGGAFSVEYLRRLLERDDTLAAFYVAYKIPEARTSSAEREWLRLWVASSLDAESLAVRRWARSAIAWNPLYQTPEVIAALERQVLSFPTAGPDPRESREIEDTLGTVRLALRRRAALAETR